VAWVALSCACSFDDDARFVPRPRAAYFLCDDGSTTGLAILDATGRRTFLPVADFDLHVAEKNTTLWTVTDGKITRKGLDDGASGETPFNAFVPLGFCAGRDRHVVWGEKKLAFVENKTKNPRIAVLDIDFTPHSALYNNQKFYLTADSLLAVYHETAFAPLLRLPLAFQAEHADFDELYNFVAMGRGTDGQYYSLKISATGNVPLSANSVSGWKRLWHSRIWKTRYGNEAVLKTAGIRTDGAVLPDVGLRVSDMFFDFRHARGYYHTGDSLKVYAFSPDLRTFEYVYGVAWPEKILKARFDASSGR
jgi:hypothetical protein